MTALNATHLFKDDSRSWPHSSESFWTALFSQFVLHLGRMPSPEYSLTIWQCRAANKPPWYERRLNDSALRLSNLTFDSVAMEPPDLYSRPWPDIGRKIPVKIGGFRPDLLIRWRMAPGNSPRIAVVENKTYGSLQKNQMQHYPALLKFLEEAQVDCQLLLLQSVGDSNKLYSQAGELQNRLKGAFGIILWEDVIRVMLASSFSIAGVDLSNWQRFAAALDTDAVL